MNNLTLEKCLEALRPKDTPPKLNDSTEKNQAFPTILSSSLEPDELLQEEPLSSRNALENGPTDQKASPLKAIEVNVKPVHQMDPEKAFAM